MDSFWNIWCHFSALGCHWATQRSQDASSIDFASILKCLWDPLAHPSGRLFDFFGRPGGPRTEKNDALESVCSQARFLIVFSLLFKCLGCLKTAIPCKRGVQNRIFDQDRTNCDFDSILACFYVQFGTILAIFGQPLGTRAHFFQIFSASILGSFF